jgi:nitrogen fixation/metabolism regulation signal transduction histidine kinase
LQQARAGAYNASALTDVPEKLRDIYFEPVGEKHVFRRDLRRQVIFGRNDLTRDAPISRVDLLVHDELQVINDELRGRTEELDHTNSFLGSVLRSLGSAVIVLTEELRVRVWSAGAEDLWGSARTKLSPGIS